MQRAKLLLAAAGFAAFLLFLVARAPASLLARQLPPALSLAGIDGTIWSGRAAAVSLQGRPLGAAAWSCRPWRLLMLEWACRLQLKPAGGELSAQLAGNLHGDMEAREVTGRLPLAWFEGLVATAGWSGWLEADVRRVRVASGLPFDAEGRLYLRALQAPGPDGAALGDFEVLIGQGTVGTGTLSARLRDLGGPLRVRGTLTLEQDRSYLVRGEVAPGPGAGDAIFDTLAFLGPPDSLGRRPFTVEGKL